MSGHLAVKKKGVKLVSKKVQAKVQVSGLYLKMKVNMSKQSENKRREGMRLGWRKDRDQFLRVLGLSPASISNKFQRW